MGLTPLIKWVEHLPCDSDREECQYWEQSLSGTVQRMSSYSIIPRKSYEVNPHWNWNTRRLTPCACWLYLVSSKLIHSQAYLSHRECLLVPHPQAQPWACGYCHQEPHSPCANRALSSSLYHEAERNEHLCYRSPNNNTVQECVRREQLILT